MAIPISELRIGSVVAVDGLIVSIEDMVTSVENGYLIRVLYTRENKDAVSFVRPIKDLHPIPLSGEVLQKCGFKYNKIEGVARISDDFEEPEGDTEYWELGKLTIVSWNKGPYTLSNKSSFDHRIEVTSLHQLMNVAFSLTGKELIYNPSK